MLRETYPFYLANAPRQPNTDLVVVDKYTGEVATRVAMATPEVIDQGIGAAVEARADLALRGCRQRALPVGRRDRTADEAAHAVRAFGIVAHDHAEEHEQVLPLDRAVPE